MPSGARPSVFFRVSSGRQLHRFQYEDPLKHWAQDADARYVIELHRLHGNGAIVVNADLVETVEACPDTVVTLVTKRRFVVEDSVEDVLEGIAAWRARVAKAIQANEDSAVAARVIAMLDEGEQAA